jgi:NitT/TauT family transport system substrate-binding protein
VALMFRRGLVDSGQVRGPADLQGRRVALPARGIPTEALLAAWLRPSGLRVDDVEIVELGFPDQLPAFGSGAIDATVIPEPFQTRLLDQSLATIYQRSDEIYPGYQVAEVMYGATFPREQPEVARRFMIAYLRGVRVYNDAVVKGDPTARQTTASLMAMAGVHPDGRLNVSSLADNQEYWLSTGQQQARIDLGLVVDYSFADAALQVLGPYR